MVCDQCGHTNDHTSPPTLNVPYQPRGTTAFTVLVTTQCSVCFCNLYIPRVLLPSEPVL